MVTLIYKMLKKKKKTLSKKSFELTLTQVNFSSIPSTVIRLSIKAVIIAKCLNLRLFVSNGKGRILM